MLDLKSESKRCFSVVSDARGSWPDLQDLRQTVSEGLKGKIIRHHDALRSVMSSYSLLLGLQPLLGGEGGYAYGASIKGELQNIRVEASNCEQHGTCRTAFYY